MPVLTKTKFVPIPEGVYNIKVVKYEAKEQKNQPGAWYYQWMLQILDTLPEDFVGRDTFGVITAMELTENNNLSKFLANAGVSVDVGEDVDLDTLINYKFVGKVIVTQNKRSGQDNNGLGQLTITEYERFNARKKTGGFTAKAVKRPATVAEQNETSGPVNPAVNTDVNPVPRTEPRPPARVVIPESRTSTPRPKASIPQQQTPVVSQSENEEEETERFPDEV